MEEGSRLAARLASSEAQRDAVRAELASAQSAMDTGVDDFHALEAKLCETESACERLRSGVEVAEKKMSEVCVRVCPWIQSSAGERI